MGILLSRLYRGTGSPPAGREPSPVRLATAGRIRRSLMKLDGPAAPTTWCIFALPSQRAFLAVSYLVGLSIEQSDSQEEEDEEAQDQMEVDESDEDEEDDTETRTEEGGEEEEAEEEEEIVIAAIGGRRR